MKVLILIFLLGIGYLIFYLVARPPVSFEASFLSQEKDRVSLSKENPSSAVRTENGAFASPAVVELDSEPSQDTASTAVATNESFGKDESLSHQQKLDLMRKKGRAIVDRIEAERESRKAATSWFALPVRVKGQSNGMLICEVDMPEAPAPPAESISFSSGLGGVGGASGETGGGRSSLPALDIVDLLVAEAPGGGGRRRLPRAQEQFALVGHPDYDNLNIGSRLTVSMIPEGLEHVFGRTLKIFRYYKP